MCGFSDNAKQLQLDRSDGSKGKANACLARELCKKKLQDQSKTYSNSSISAINSTTKQKG